MKAKLLMFLIAATMSSHVIAAQINCTGTIDRLYVFNTDKGLYINGSYHGTYSKICGLESEWKGVSVDMCKYWFSLVQGSYHANNRVIVSYPNPTFSACNAIPSYSNAPAPHYIMLLE